VVVIFISLFFFLTNLSHTRLNFPTDSFPIISWSISLLTILLLESFINEISTDFFIKRSKTTDRDRVVALNSYSLSVAASYNYT